MDARMLTLARQIVTYSIAVAPGENVLIESWDSADEITCALVEEIARAGGRPVVVREDARVRRALLLGLTKPSAELLAQLELERIQKMQAFISIRKSENVFEYSGLPPENVALYQLATAESRRHRMLRTKWCVLKFPCPSMAQMFHMGTGEFESFYYNAMLLDYQKMSQRAEPLMELMKRTDRVHIKAADTDISFSIKGCKGGPAFLNDTGNGRMNLPDGEVGGGVVKDSVNGVIHYNLPTTYNGIAFSSIRFEVAEGKIVKATCSDPARQQDLTHILDTDPDARYFGEFSLGINPAIHCAVGDILFDEKMWGTFHFTPGHTPSAIHWDMVLSQKAEDGGGEIWFDGLLIRKDGYFLPEPLLPLNPERLLPEIQNQHPGIALKTAQNSLE